MTLSIDRSGVDLERDTSWVHVPRLAVVEYRRDVFTVEKAMTDDDRSVVLTHARRRCPKCPHRGTPHPGAEVMILYPGHPKYVEPPAVTAANALPRSYGPKGQAALAVALLQVRLGAVVVATKDDDAPFVCPPTGEHPLPARARRDLAHHLYLFHDLSVTEFTGELTPDMDSETLLRLHQTSDAQPHDHR